MNINLQLYTIVFFKTNNISILRI